MDDLISDEMGILGTDGWYYPTEKTLTKLEERFPGEDFNGLRWCFKPEIQTIIFDYVEPPNG